MIVNRIVLIGLGVEIVSHRSSLIARCCYNCCNLRLGVEVLTIISQKDLGKRSNFVSSAI